MSVQTSSMYARHSSFGPSLPTIRQPAGARRSAEPDRILFFVVHDNLIDSVIIISHGIDPHRL